MWGSPFGNGSSPPVWAPRPRVGSAGSCMQAEVARPPGADAVGAPVGRVRGPRAAFTGLMPPAFLSPELWAVASARERSVLWKEERKFKRRWAGGKAARGCGQGRRSGWAVPETILPGALHPQPGCCAGFPAKTCVLRSPGRLAGASSCRPHVRPQGRCVWEKVSIARRRCISGPGAGQVPVELDVSGPRVGFQKQQLDVRERQQAVTPASLSQVTSFTASARRITGTGCRRPRGAAPRAWPRCPPLRPPPSQQPPRLTWPTSQPCPSPKQPPPPASWSRSRASVLLPWAPRPPLLMALSAHPLASAGELCLVGRLGRRSLTPQDASVSGLGVLEWYLVHTRLPRWSLSAKAGDRGSVPLLGRPPGGGHGNPLQCSGLEKPVDRGAWGAAVHGVRESRTRPSDLAHAGAQNNTRC